MTTGRRATAAALLGLFLPACTSPVTGPSATTSPTDVDDQAGTTSPTPTPSPSPSTEPGSAFGTGTVTVDGTAFTVTGDCDISRDLGQAPVQTLRDEQLDVLLAVDNVGGQGQHGGPYAVEVRLLGSGAMTQRTITSIGADAGADGGTAPVTYEGVVEVAELRDRERLEFVDVATLHLEAGQQRTRGSVGPSSRQLVVDVRCRVARPS